METNKKKCPSCSGSGKIKLRETYYPHAFYYERCSKCGVSMTKKCPSCDGKGKPNTILYWDEEKKQVLARLYIIAECGECEQRFFLGDDGRFYSHVDQDGYDELSEVEDWIHEGKCDGCEEIMKNLSTKE